MPEHFSKATASMPVSPSVATSWPSDQPYPAAFLPTREQSAIVKRHVDAEAGTSLIQGTGTLAINRSRPPGIDDNGEDDELEVDNLCYIDGALIGPLYMVCLMIMINESKPWQVHMSRL